jgi:5-methylcytosine-specific restriction enzyme subunit McrC
MPDQKITEVDFQKLVLNRKTQDYRKALEISRLILLHFHPDLRSGRNDVLALMFDMNKLWEKFVLASLKKDHNLNARGQDSTGFWQSERGNRRSIRPDITIELEKEKYVIDTKWKLVSSEPSMDDLRQMYAYHHYFNAKKVALLYPGKHPNINGSFVRIDSKEPIVLPEKEVECGLLFSQIETTVKDWQVNIGKMVNSWAN